MRKELNIRIPKPCHEDWQQMSIQPGGRHCASCAKTVIDFTSASDETIVKQLSSNSNLCGRFKNNQLNRPVVLERKETTLWKTTVAAAMLSLLSLQSQESKAQGTPKIEVIDSLGPQQIKGKVATSILKQKVIKGVVVDAEGLPIPGATILMKGTSIGTQSDFDGNFALKVKQGSILVCSYIGYETQELSVKQLSKLTIKLEMSDAILGEIVTVGYVAYDYEYIPTKEELETQKRLRTLSKSNYFKFYKRNRKQKREARRQRRAERKAASIATRTRMKLQDTLSQILKRF